MTAGNIGTTTLRANAPGVAEALAAIETIELDLGSIAVVPPTGGNILRVGPGLQTPINVLLENTPPNPVDITLTIADDSLATLSEDPNVVGTSGCPKCRIQM